MSKKRSGCWNASLPPTSDVGSSCRSGDNYDGLTVAGTLISRLGDEALTEVTPAVAFDLARALKSDMSPSPEPIMDSVRRCLNQKQ